MDFKLNELQQDIRDIAREYAQKCVLPRVDEITVDVDSDPRACYFKQVFNGKIMRKSLILKLLKEAEENPVAAKRPTRMLSSNACTNSRCICKTERGLIPQAVETDEGLRCAFCESRIDG